MTASFDITERVRPQVAEIVKPIEVWKTSTGKAICVWPWFDYENVPELNAVWLAYRNARRKCGIPYGWPLYDDGAYIFEKYGSKDMEMLLDVALKGGQYLKHSKKRMVWDGIESTYTLKPFACARAALRKAIAKAADLGTITV